jgi:uncharacterized membrane protein
VTLAPLLGAPLVIAVHAFAAMAAFALGLVQLVAPKGTLPHRMLGWIWAGLMLAVVLSSFGIHTIRSLGPFSPIHALSLFTLAMLPLALLQARRHRAAQHGLAMVLLFTGALVIAGAFTFYPGRIMHAVAFGG